MALAAFQQPSQSVQDINAASGAKHKLHCKFCNKIYRSSKRLAQHMYGHTGLSWTMQKGGGFSAKLQHQSKYDEDVIWSKVRWLQLSEEAGPCILAELSTGRVDQIRSIVPELDKKCSTTLSRAGWRR